jgi:hypothetical protein
MKSAGALCGDYALMIGKRFRSAELWELYATQLKAEADFANSRARSE